MAFPSVYEMTNPLTTVRKQHFWEYFSGADITQTTESAFNSSGNGFGAEAGISNTQYRRGVKINSGSSAIGKTIKKISTHMHRVGSPTGNISYKVYRSGSVIATSPNVDITTISTSFTTIEYILDVTVTLQADDRIVAEWDNRSASGNLTILYNNSPNTIASGFSHTSWNGSAWSDITYDIYFNFDSTPASSVLPPTRWAITNFNSVTGATAMADEVNGGIKLTTSGNRSALQFNNIRQFSNTGSEIIWVVKQAGSGANGAVGLAKNSNGFFNSGVHVDFPTSGNSNFYTLNDAGAGSYTSTGKNVSESFSYHTYKMTCSASSQTCSIDGVTVATRDNNQDPDEKMQPVATAYNSSTTLHLQYCEAYNT
jgi:hypothetical protein